MGTRAEIEMQSDAPRAHLWDRIADVFRPGDQTSSTAVAVLAYMSGSESAEEER
jgi:hypothetical protein